MTKNAYVCIICCLVHSKHYRKLKGQSRESGNVEYTRDGEDKQSKIHNIEN